MSITIKQLGAGQLVSGGTNGDLTPLIPLGKAWIVKGMRFYNASSSAAAALTVTLASVNPGASPAAASNKIIANVSIPPLASFIDDSEISLDSTPVSSASVTKLTWSKPNPSGPIDYVISGIERDA